MTIEQYTDLMQHPYKLRPDHLEALEQLVADYPYCASARMMRLRLLREQEDLNYAAELPRTAVFTTPQQLHRFVHAQAPQAKPHPTSGGSYFDMMDKLQQMSDQQHESLQSLAARLLTPAPPTEEPAASTPQEAIPAEEPATTVPQAATPAEASAEEPTPPTPAATAAAEPSSAPTPEAAPHPHSTDALSVEELVAQQRFDEAIELLKSTNLNNPKKSAYFADQIRFLATAAKLTAGSRPTDN